MRKVAMAVLAVLALGVGQAAAQAIQDPLEHALDLGNRDQAAGAEAMLKLAQADDHRAQWYYAMYLLNGRGVARDEAQAWTWVKASAEGGHSEGMVSAAVMLATGQGVAEDDVAARGWYRKAAEGGSAHALRSLGGMVLTGEGGPAEKVRGLAYIELAHDGGDELAGKILGRVNITLTTEELREAQAIKAEWKRKFGTPK
mgnify:CR=1 FL=1